MTAKGDMGHDGYRPPRFSKVPWLLDLADLRAFGRPETTVEEEGEITHGLLIPDPFGKDTTAMLEIHAKRGNGNDGGEITLAIVRVLTFDVTPEPTKKKPMDLDLLTGKKPYLDQSDANDGGD